MKIALICASPRRMNLGMLSVDLAAESFFRHCGCHNVEFSRFCVDQALDLPVDHDLTLHYHHLTDPDRQLGAYDLIVYWGDFLHAHVYLNSVVRRLTGNDGLCGSREQAENHVYRTLLLENASREIRARTAAIGGTIYTNATDSLLPARYVNAISSLYQTCLLVTPRDPVSAAMSRLYGQYHTTVGTAVDNAFHLNPGQFFPALDNRDDAPENLGISFGRGIYERKRPWRLWAAARLVRSLKKRFKPAPIIDIDWLKRRDATSGLAEKIHLIRRCRLVITDTYHCAVTCWREGVPAVCIGQGAALPRHTTDDKKSELLYYSLQAGRYYLFREELLSLRGGNHFIERLADEINQQSHLNIISGLNLQKQTSCRLIGTTIRRLSNL